VRQYQPGQGPRGTGPSYAAGPVGEGTAAGRHQHHGGCERISAGFCADRLATAGGQLQPHEVHAEADKTPAALAGKLVDIYDFPDGRLEIRWKGLPLAYSAFDQLQRVSHAAIIENKRLGEVLAWIKQQQDKQPHHRGDLVGPKRSNQKAGLMKDRVDRLAQDTKLRTRPARLGRRRCDSDVSAAPAQATSEAAK
jgi:hypothetical protein